MSYSRGKGGAFPQSALHIMYIMPILNMFLANDQRGKGGTFSQSDGHPLIITFPNYQVPNKFLTFVANSLISYNFCNSLSGHPTTSPSKCQPAKNTVRQLYVVRRISPLFLNGFLLHIVSSTAGALVVIKGFTSPLSPLFAPEPKRQYCLYRQCIIVNIVKQCKHYKQFISQGGATTTSISDGLFMTRIFLYVKRIFVCAYLSC